MLNISHVKSTSEDEGHAIPWRGLDALRRQKGSSKKRALIFHSKKTSVIIKDITCEFNVILPLNELSILVQEVSTSQSILEMKQSIDLNLIST